MRNFNKLITFIILLGSFMNLQSQNKYSNRKIDNLKNQAVQLVEENKKQCAIEFFSNSSTFVILF